MTRALRFAWTWWVEAFWRPWVVVISVPQILVAAAILIVADRLYLRVGDAWYGAFCDEPAHIITALLALNLLPRRWRDPILPPALIASFAIDADHLPEYVLHDDFLTVGTPRPYTHSLTTIAVMLVIALAWPRRRTLFVGIAVGLALHFFRDMAENGFTGVALLWPLSDHSFAYSQGLYLGFMAALVAANLLMAAWARPPEPSPAEPNPSL